MLVSRSAILSSALVSAGILAACSGGDTDADYGATSSGAGGETSTAAAGNGGAKSTTAAGNGGAKSTVAGTGGAVATTTAAGTGGAAATDGGVQAQTDPPQVVDPAPAGPVLTTPKVQLIAYAEDTFVPDVEKFLVELTKTTTWAEQTLEYGVGALSILPTISIAGTPPATLDDNSGTVTPFETTLANNLSGASPAWGAADPSTIYLFVLPQGTQVNSGGLCCDPSSGYFGYHYEAPVGSSSVAYAVVCNCPSFVVAPLTALDDLTTTISHELDEAATNPFVTSKPAFGQEDDPHAIWITGSFGGEVADMCQDPSDSNYLPPGSTYMVQRSWSNAAARAGTNPCVPVPATGPYFNSYPTMTDQVVLTNGSATGMSVTTTGVKIPVGQSKTIDVVLHSEAPTSGPWTVSVQDLSEYLGDTAATTVSLDKTSGNDGDVLHLTIKVLSVDPTFGGEGFVLSSTLGGQNNLWFGAVSQ